MRMIYVVPAIIALLAPAVGLAAEKPIARCKPLPASAGTRLVECRGKVDPRGANFVFTFLGIRDKGDEFGGEIDTIEVRRVGRKALLQTIVGPGWERKGSKKDKTFRIGKLDKPHFVLRDINFDGYADIHIFARANYGCVFNHYYLYDPAKSRYGKKLDEWGLPIGGLACGTVVLDARRKEVRTIDKPRNSINIVTRRYRWRGRKLTLNRAVVRVYARSGKCRERHYRAVGGKPDTKLKPIGIRACPRYSGDMSYGDEPNDRDLAKPKTFDQWIR